MYTCCMIACDLILKGIVLWELHIYIFWYQLIDRSYTFWSRSFAFKISFSCPIFRFLRLGVVSLPVGGAGLLDFPQLMLYPRTGSPLRRSCKCCFCGKILKVDTVPARGALCSPVLTASGALINFLCKTNGKYLAFEPQTSTG
jgi:hypothetical protein